MQSLAVLDTRTGAVVDYPDERTLVNSKQVLFSGLAFSSDGKRVYGSIVSMSDPLGKKGTDTGAGVQVYGFDEGRLTRERVIKIAPQKLAVGRHTLLTGGGEPGGRVWRWGRGWDAGDAISGGDCGLGSLYAGKGW